jgi:hypothetical protein
MSKSVVSYIAYDLRQRLFLLLIPNIEQGHRYNEHNTNGVTIVVVVAVTLRQLFDAGS